MNRTLNKFKVALSPHAVCKCESTDEMSKQLKCYHHISNLSLFWFCDFKAKIYEVHVDLRNRDVQFRFTVM